MSDITIFKSSSGTIHIDFDRPFIGTLGRNGIASLPNITIDGRE